MILGYILPPPSTDAPAFLNLVVSLECGEVRAFRVRLSFATSLDADLVITTMDILLGCTELQASPSLTTASPQASLADQQRSQTAKKGKPTRGEKERKTIHTIARMTLIVPKHKRVLVSQPFVCTRHSMNGEAGDRLLLLGT